MNTKLILSSFIFSILIIFVNCACFIYVCDSQVDDIKCVNTTGNITNHLEIYINFVSNLLIVIYFTRTLGNQIKFKWKKILWMLFKSNYEAKYD